MLTDDIRAYVPVNEQEARDKALILSCLSLPGVFTRENALCHMTASAWICDPAREKVLLAYHNLYRSWSWLGGHADGEEDLLAVALREAREESGLVSVVPVTGQIFSLEALPVFGHEKRGVYVSSHLHLNVTYLLEADPSDPVFAKQDENSAVGWFTPDEMERAVSEKWMLERVYRKLSRKMKGESV